MSDRTKLTLASLAVMLLPYRIDFPVAVVVVTAIISTAIDLAKERWDRMQPCRYFIVANVLHPSLESRRLSNYQSAIK